MLLQLTLATLEPQFLVEPKVLREWALLLPILTAPLLYYSVT